MLAAITPGVVVIPATTLLTTEELRDRRDRGRARAEGRRPISGRNLPPSVPTISFASMSGRAAGGFGTGGRPAVVLSGKIEGRLKEPGRE